MASGMISVTSTVAIDAADITETFSTSGGPGGQHANKTSSRVELTVDLETVRGLNETQRRRAITKLGPMLKVSADDDRSQVKNRRIARQRLIDKLESAIQPVRKRRPTKPTKGSMKRRLKSKKQRSELKAQRSKVQLD